MKEETSQNTFLTFFQIVTSFLSPVFFARCLFLLQPLPAVLPVSGSSLAFFIAFGYSTSLPSPSSSAPAQACEPAGMYVLYTFHSFSCDGSVVRDGRSLSGYQLNSQPGTLWQQVPLGNVQNLIIIFLECFTWPLFL